MGRLSEQIKQAVARKEYDLSIHAMARLRERLVVPWQVEVGLSGGRLLSERPDTEPNPTIEVILEMPDGTEAKAVWAWVPDLRRAKLVKVPFLDRERYVHHQRNHPLDPVDPRPRLRGGGGRARLDLLGRAGAAVL